MGKFLEKNWHYLLGVLAAVFLCYARIDDLQRRLVSIEQNGTTGAREAIQALTQRADAADKVVSSVQMDARSMNIAIIGLQSDMRLVVDWVQEQKRKERAGKQHD